MTGRILREATSLGFTRCMEMVFDAIKVRYSKSKDVYYLSFLLVLSVCDFSVSYIPLYSLPTYAHYRFLPRSFTLIGLVEACFSIIHPLSLQYLNTPY